MCASNFRSGGWTNFDSSSAWKKIILKTYEIPNNCKYGPWVYHVPQQSTIYQLDLSHQRNLTSSVIESIQKIIFLWNNSEICCFCVRSVKIYSLLIYLPWCHQLTVQVFKWLSIWTHSRCTCGHVSTCSNCFNHW